ncbi:hypothetical protein BDP27DRAFT_595783 [Rhodocollybia butyracea]|uniref:Uncharacterized protein n=1 Tax=Rhodocollybia butyracea TaxID=206335 RepID=A0A9P5P7V8_9AGAR|nr:hypothetical protein BDP27DRAFT_595783 [Rhodocollybia butyracea]
MSGPTVNAPNCTISSFQWSFNSLGQSPCQVAGYLGSCSNGTYYIPDILTPQKYNNALGPLNNCTCSSVFYSALSACASCQGTGYSTWPEWHSICAIVFVTDYPNAVPPDTAIPLWAFQEYSADPKATFNITLAQAQGDLPEETPRALGSSASTAPSRSTSTASLRSTSTGLLSSTNVAPPSSTSTPSPKPTGSESGAGKPNNTMISSSNTSKKKLGEILGGAIGTLALLLGLGLGLWWLWKRKGRTEQKLAGTNSIHRMIPYVPQATDSTRQLTSTKRAEVQQRTEELVQSMRELRQSQVTVQPVDESNDLNTGTARDPLQSRIQQIEARMENFMTEMSQYIQPPAYENGTIL